MVPIGSADSDKKILKFFPIRSHVKLSSAVAAILVGPRDAGYNFGRRPSKDHSTKVWFQLAQQFQTRRFLNQFPMGSYVKLSSAVAAILVGGDAGYNLSRRPSKNHST